MIINDLSMLGTKIEVWKEYLKLEQKTQDLNKLNQYLLLDITPKNLEDLEDFIRGLENSLSND